MSRHSRNRRNLELSYTDGSESSDSFIALSAPVTTGASQQMPRQATTKSILTVRVNNNNEEEMLSVPTPLIEDDDDDDVNVVLVTDTVNGNGTSQPSKVPEVATTTACLLCTAPFNLLLNKRVVCSSCSLSVCRNCCAFLEQTGDWICTVCEQHRSLANHCSSWICKRLKNAVHFGDAKHRLSYDEDENIEDDGDDDIQDSDDSVDVTLDLESGADAADQRDDSPTSIGRQGDHQQHPHLSSLDNDKQQSHQSVQLKQQQQQEHHSQQQQQNGHRSRRRRRRRPTASNQQYHHSEHLQMHHQHQLYQQQQLQAATRADIELIVAKMLGVQTIDHAHVGLLFDDSQYFEFVDSATIDLADQLRDLQSTLLLAKAITDKEYNDLSRLLADASEASFRLAPLRLRNATAGEVENLLHECEYEYLLANAILNQIVEVSQSRFLTATSVAGSGGGGVGSTTFKSTSQFSPSLMSSSMSGSFRVRSSCSAGSYYANSHDSYESGKMLAQSNSPTSLEELEDEEFLDEDDEFPEYQEEENLNFDAVKVEFPEAGVDLVDSRKFPSCDSDLSHDSGIKLIDSSNTWQDNWLFKKSKDNRAYSQYHLNSDIHFGYMAMALSESVPMLIPNPSQCERPTIGNEELECQSDLSEHNSETGSLTFSDEEDETDGGRDSREGVLHHEFSSMNTPANLLPKEIKFSSLLAKAENLHNARMQARKNRVSPNINSASVAFARRFLPLKVPEFIPHENRTVSTLLPNPHQRNLGHVPSILFKPGNATIHSGITAQFCCKTSGLLPVRFAWFKDGQLIACSDEKESQKSEEYSQVRILTGLRHCHRRNLDWPNALFGNVRLLMFNECEAVLELQKTSSLMSGVYSVVAYNHAGCDWVDFHVAVDHTHFASVYPVIQVPSRCRSPRPTPRRGVKSRSSRNMITEVNSVLEHQQRAIIAMLTKAVELRKGVMSTVTATPAFIFEEVPVDDSPMIYEVIEETHLPEYSLVPRPRSRTPTSAKSPLPNFRQRTWDERQGKPGAQVLMPEAEQQSTTEAAFDELDSQTNELDPELMLISKREHSKWLHPDVELANNPYTLENVEKRSKIHEEPVPLSQDEEEEEDDEDTLEKAKFYSDRDIRRYKRDYYMPKVDENLPLAESPTFSVLNSLSGKKSKSMSNFFEEPSSLDTNSGAISTFGSLEPEPVLTLLTPEPERMIISSPIKRPTVVGSEVKREVDVEVRAASDLQIKDQVLSKLPSVKNLVSLFSSPASGKESMPSSTTSSHASPTPHTSSNQKNYKVHASITARSLQREMREASNKNMPKALNRVAHSNEMLGLGEVTDIDFRASPVNGHDNSELNYSSTQEFQSIQERAQYWDRRADLES